MLLNNDKVKSYALKKDNYISISLDSIPTTAKSSKQKPIKKEKLIPLNETKSEEIKSIAKPSPDISSLFSSVKTEKVNEEVKKIKKELDTKRLSVISKRIKTKSINKVESTYNKVKDIQLVKPNVEVTSASSASSASEVNEYLAKIQVFVYNQFLPPSTTQGSSAKVRIWIDSSGKMEDYRVIAYSGSDVFNKEVDELKMRLLSLSFPQNPENKSSVLDVILTAKE